VLPQAMFNYKFSRGTNLRIFYRTGTTTPTITQLQNVINNSNPILLTTGNPDLKQDYEHTFIVRYGKTNPQKATGLFLFLYGTYQQNYIGNSTLVPTHDTTINDAFVLKRGSQLSKPVNLQGYGTSRAVITYSLPVSKIKCNVNFNASGSYTRTPGLVNELSNIANNYTVSGGAGISSNISEKLDFNINYNINYSTISNTLQTQSNNNYYYQTTSLKLNWMFWKGFVFNTNITHTLYSGLSQSYNQSYILWNASLAYKFLKNQSFEVKASVFDMLGQNQSINRTVTDTYIEDSSTKVLTRYYMLTLTYNLRKFKP
ncbi:MAG: outer membrane beta-barrel protein, partial [Bacteroidia bacterium]